MTYYHGTTKSWLKLYQEEGLPEGTHVTPDYRVARGFALARRRWRDPAIIVYFDDYFDGPKARVENPSRNIYKMTETAKIDGFYEGRL